MTSQADPSFRILEALRAFAKRTALTASGAPLSFEELDRWSSALAAKVPAAGGRPKCIGVLAPASFEYAAALCAIWKQGNIAVPLQPQHPLAELRYLVEDTGMETMLVHPDCLEKARELSASPTVIEREFSHAGAPLPPLSSGDGALIIYTSGTTSRPKGVVITFGNLDFQIRTLCRAWGWSADDRVINVLPLHHVHGVVNILLCSLASGAWCELYPKFDAEAVWERLASREVTVFMAVPTIYSKLAQHWDRQPEEKRERWAHAAAQLRLMVSGSAALPLPLFEKWKAITGHALLERYGMTEIGMAISNPYHGTRKPKSVGKPLPGVEVRLVEDEIHVKGEGVFHEYWNKPEATRASFTADGWFRTGDQANVDEDGYYYILGRTSQDILKSGGYKISALEIESVLLERSDLVEVAVVGVADEEWGERVAAVCVWKDDVARRAQEAIDYREVKDWLRAKLAHYKVPVLWKTIDALPRNAMGKVTKPALKALFCSR